MSLLADDQHWSLQAIRKPQVQASGDGPIDGFVMAELARQRLSLAPPADRSTLVRRWYLDLIGLPPSPEEVRAFLADRHPAAEDRLVDRLLASPRHGERWAQHWLDVVRFADTHGFEVNTPRPNAWPYRDYVIQALNEDLPYRQFIAEQLAGDQLGVDEATGFLVSAAALLPGQVGQDEESIRLARQDELNEIVINTGSAFLGLTLACARCHDHKFDPISQRDYFAMQAMFAGVRYGERPWRNVPRSDKQREMSAIGRELASIDQALARTGLRAPVNSAVNEERFEPVLAKFVRFTILESSLYEPCIDEWEVWTAGEGAAKNIALAECGTMAQSSGDLFNSASHRLAHINDGKFGNGRSWIATEKSGGWVSLRFAQPERINRMVWGRDRERVFADRTAMRYVIEAALEPGQWRRVASSDDRIPFVRNDGDLVGLEPATRELLARRKLLLDRQGRLTQADMVFAGNFQKPPSSFLLNRGDPMQPREVVAPDVPGVFGKLELGTEEPDEARRLRLAKWLADPANPLTPRVMVNRLWQHHFGLGLVETPSDFGKMGGAPSHPELLNWLAACLRDNDWSLKRLHREIVLSRAFRQESKRHEQGQAFDAKNRLLWHYPSRRLEAEAIRDAILQVSGSLDLTMGGPGFLVFKPNDNYVRVYDPKEEFGPGDWRRMIYSHRVRMAKDGVFGAFDYPDAGQVCPTRACSTTPIQALNLFNGAFVLQQAKFLAERAELEADHGATHPLDRLFWLVLGRAPSVAESNKARQVAEQDGLEVVARALLNSNEFLWLP